MGNIEDQRNASAINAGISSQVLSASLVLMGVLLGYFDIKNLKFLSFSGILILLAATLLLISFIVGGLGLKTIRDKGNDGDWNTANTHGYFRTQTRLNFLAIAIFVGVFFLPSNPSEQDLKMDQININLKKIATMDSIAIREQSELIELRKRISTLEEASKKHQSKIDCLGNRSKGKK